MKNATLMFLILTLVSCSNDTKRSYAYIYEQKSPNEEYSIFHFQRFGMMAFGSDVVGTRIMQKGEKFSERKGKFLNGDVKQWISEDTLEIYRFKNMDKYINPKDTFQKVLFEKIYNLTLRVIENDAINSFTSEEWYFDSLSISSRKITFFGLKNKRDESSFEESRSFELGNFKINHSYIKHYYIRKSMDATYLNKDGTRTIGLPKIEKVQVYFYPTKFIQFENFESETGFYLQKNSF